MSASFVLLSIDSKISPWLSHHQEGFFFSRWNKYRDAQPDITQRERETLEHSASSGASLSNPSPRGSGKVERV